MTTATKNISDKEMIRDFTKLTTDLKIHRINPGFHFLDNESSTALNMEMTTMEIKYQLVPPSNHREKHANISIHTFKNYSIAGICSIDKDFHLKLR